MSIFVTFLTRAVRLSSTFLFGATGETITEKAGHLNLGIPGIMCVGAVGGCFGVSAYMGTVTDPYNANAFLVVLIPILTSILFSCCMGMIYSFLTVSLRCNQNVTGLALTTFGVGFTNYFINTLDTSRFNAASGYFTQGFPFANALGDFGKIFFSYGIFVYMAIAIALLSSYFLNRTRMGLHLRAVGENPATADAAGINVSAYRYIATCIGSAIAGLGGLSFIMDNMGGNWEYTIDAMGWLSIALVIFTMWKPNFAILGSIVFGGLYIAGSYIAATTEMKELIKMLPYVVTIIVLIITSVLDSKENQPPAALGLPYFREER